MGGSAEVSVLAIQGLYTPPESTHVRHLTFHLLGYFPTMVDLSSEMLRLPLQKALTGSRRHWIHGGISNSHAAVLETPTRVFLVAPITRLDWYIYVCFPLVLRERLPLA